MMSALPMLIGKVVGAGAVSDGGEGFLVPCSCTAASSYCGDLGCCFPCHQDLCWGATHRAANLDPGAEQLHGLAVAS
jgi:hypothetical protein